MSLKPARLGWYATSYSPKIASIRLRLLKPMAFLREQGLDVERYRSSVGPAGYDAIVFSKAFCKDALQVARAAKAEGKTVVFDMCDNIFEAKQSRKKAGKVARFREMITMADCLVFSTPVLRSQILAAVPEATAQSHVIPDTIEDMHVADGANVRTSLSLMRLKLFLARREDALHCVWFGKCQGNRAGLVHVDAAVRELEIFARRYPVTLTIIGNKRLKYWQASRKWGIPHIYVPWSLEQFPTTLAMHDIALIPVEQNSYTIGKTLNRPATAIAAGLGVIADSIDAYEELRPFIVLDDWQAGLERYQLSKSQGDCGIEEGRAYLERRYGQTAVGNAWLALGHSITATA
ncbi:MAG: hypothetical protein QHC67_02400 [Sphingobium sp.]|uniref:hypothetical protein n=1 Tax=Sphingobium sp. TaxID=1912891 RepID=UPI0029B5823F|nr:hypothetical protein [Sphingobium sp.]MDX3908649.1 hypothetical protein [Sphingobium sp.]